MNKNKVIIFLVSLTFIAPIIGFAQIPQYHPDPSFSPDARGSFREVVKDIKDDRQDRAEDVREIRQERRDSRDDIRQGVIKELKAERENNKDVIGKQRQEVKEKIKAERKDFREKVKSVKENESFSADDKKKEVERIMEQQRKLIDENRDGMKIKIEEERKKLKERLSTIKDKKKVGIVENLDLQIAKINERTVKHFLTVLDTLEAHTARLSARMKTAQQEGKDVVKIETAINETKKMINDSRNAANQQLVKIYKMNITGGAVGEDNLKSEIKPLVEEFKRDIKKIEDMLKAARDAAQRATILVAKISGNISQIRPTVSPLITPSAPPSFSATPSVSVPTESPVTIQ